MSNQDQQYDGALISELGIKRYLKATKDIKVSNVDFLLRGAALNKAWQQCNFGCHGPSYRSLRRPSNKAKILQQLSDITPVLAGVVDGVHHQTVVQAERITGGIKRTAEGLHVTGDEAFHQVGDENTAAFQFAKTTFNNLLTFEIDFLENPVAQIVMLIVSEYTAVLPEWVIEETVKQGSLKFPDKIDTVWLLKASAIGIIDQITPEQVNQAAKLLNEPAQRFVAKQVGKKLATALAMAIASAICKKLLSMSAEAQDLKHFLARTRKSMRKLNGGLGGTMITLLKAQGMLDKAADHSRQLQRSCPRLWNILHYKLNGANMVYFLVADMVQEYVDRLELLERNPKEFGKVIEALVRDKRTRDIFFP